MKRRLCAWRCLLELLLRKRRSKPHGICSAAANASRAARRGRGPVPLPQHRAAAAPTLLVPGRSGAKSNQPAQCPVNRAGWPVHDFRPLKSAAALLASAAASAPSHPWRSTTGQSQPQSDGRPPSVEDDQRAVYWPRATFLNALRLPSNAALTIVRKFGLVVL